MSPIERETKLVVSERDFQRVLADGQLLESTDQLNIYFQDPGLIGKRSGYFRVRLEAGGGGMATLKIPVGWKGVMREMLELEHPLSEAGPSLSPRPKRWIPVGDNLPEVIAEHLRALGASRLRRLGWMRNHRSVVHWQGLGSVELDRTVLPDGAVLYEVEIEGPSEEQHHALVAKVKSIAPSATISMIGKYSRFKEAAGLA